MNISKLKVRRLIRESVDDFFKADYVGTSTGETFLPQQAYREIRNWFENNMDSVEKLRAFKNKAKPGTQNRQDFLNQADELASGITSDSIPGGLNMREIEKIRAQYISSIGDILLQNNPKLLAVIIKGHRHTASYQEDLNNINILFETLFSAVDQIGLGPVNYEEFKRAKEELNFMVVDPNPKSYTGSRYPNALKDKAPPEAIPVVTGGPRKNKTEPTVDRSHNITNQLRYIDITNNLSLCTIIVDLRYSAEQEYLGNFSDEDITSQAFDIMFNDIGYGSNTCAILGLEYIGPSLDRFSNTKPKHHDFFGVKLLVLGPEGEIADLEVQIENLEGEAEDIGMAVASVKVEYEIDDTIIHIEPNSMNSTIDFALNQNRYGIPTTAKSASGISKQHKDFLQIILDYHNDMSNGTDRSEDPELGETNLDFIFNTLKGMGHDYESII